MLDRSLRSFSPREIFAFIADEPLLSYFMVRSKIVEDDKFPFCAGVYVEKGRINLLLNPTMLNKFNPSEKLGVLVHEYLHIVLQHCTSRHSQKGTKKMKENVAMDMAINQMIVKCWSLPDVAVFHNKGPFNYPAGLTAEQYFELIDKQITDEQFEGMFPSMDDHSQWEECSPQDASVIREIMKGYANTRQGQEKGNTLKTAGDHFGNVMEQLLAIQDEDIPWYRYASYFLTKVRSDERKRTYKRPNKRYGFPAQGKTFKTKTRACVIIDTSGSMASTFLQHILGHLNMLTRVMEIDILMCDTGVQGEKIKKFKPQEELAFQGRGGTDLQPAFDKAKEDGYCAVICFTDGGLFKETGADIKTLWVCCNNKSFNPAKGEVIHTTWND